MINLPNDDVKLVPCNNCGADVIVNAKYPIKSVDRCVHCPSEAQAPPKNDKNVCKTDQKSI